MGSTPSTAQLNAGIVLQALHTLLNRQAGTLGGDYGSAASIYLHTALDLFTAATSPGGPAASLFQTYIRVLRTAARNHMAALAAGANPPPAGVAAQLDSQLAGGVYTQFDGLAYTPAVQAAARTLANAFLLVPAGGFNAAAAGLAALVTPASGGSS